MQIVLTPEILLAAYSQGLFPMAHGARSDYVHWVCPELRGQISITGMHVPRRLRKSVRHMKIKSVPYEIRINTDFRGVIEACAEETDDRVETWINDEIVEAYCTLHELGYVHSVECWQEGALVGGLYGVAIGGAFFGESMFSRRTDTSKVSLVHLVARLHHGGFEMLDTQFTNAHLEQFDVYEIKHQEYMERLSPILKKPCDFTFSDISEKKLVQKYFEMQDQSSSKS